MQGADEYYDLIDKADQLNVGRLRRINCYGYGYGFQYKNFVFLISTHARGKCFSIWLFENENITDVLKDNHIKIYGVTGGQRGWTETYGWLCEGKWINIVEQYFEKLKQEIYREEHKEEIKQAELIVERKKLFEDKVQRFDKMLENFNL